MTDPIPVLTTLRSAESNPDRARRVRDRCRQRLRTLDGLSQPRPRARRRVWESVVLGLGGVYFTAILHYTLQFYGVL
jgi:hypothetical protein